MALNLPTGTNCQPRYACKWPLGFLKPWPLGDYRHLTTYISTLTAKRLDGELWVTTVASTSIMNIVWASPSTGHAGGTKILSRKRFPRVGRGIGSPGQLPDPS